MQALCCVYTHLEYDDDYDVPWMELYQGWQWMDARLKASSIMEDTMNDICDMQMGARYCVIAPAPVFVALFAVNGRGVFPRF